MADNNTNKSVLSRRKWTHNETIAFLEAYSQRKDEFEHPRKKKFAMANVLEDLLSRSILTETTTVDMLTAKMKTLTRAYKQAKDNASKTGAGCAHIPFGEQLDELFGNRPIISNTHCLALSGSPVQPLSCAPSTSEKGKRFNDGDEKDNASKNPKRLCYEKYLEGKLETKKKYFEKKLNLAAEKENNKQQRHNEKMALIAQFIERQE